MPPETLSPSGETIGQRLKRLRLERGLSQRELAAPGVSYAYISRIEAGTRQPSVKALRKLAEKLGVTADFLETGSELDPTAARELRLSDLELAVRLGDADGSEEALHDVLADAIAHADAHSAYRARVALAGIAEGRADHEAAIELLEAALAEEPFQPVERVDVYGNLARVYGAAGRTSDAVRLLERCLDGCGGAPAAEGRYAVVLSYALSDMGEVARAEEVAQRAVEHLRDSEDPYMRVRLYWSLARLAAKEGRQTTALANIRKAIALLETTEDALNLARAHIVAAGILVERGDADRTSEHLDHADRLLGVTPSKDDVVEMRILRSRVATIAGDASSAVALAREALEIETQRADRGYALVALADALALAGKQDEASATYGEAVDILEAESRWRPAANAARAWGNLLRSTGREAEALDVLDRAAELGMRAAPQHARTDR
jgi:transcriptional regulator with XRE-family HTH domain